MAKALSLIQGIVDRSLELGIVIVECYAADSDESKTQILRDAGFALEGRSKDRIRTDGAIHDMLRFRKTAGGMSAPYREREHYYGEMKQWEGDRIRSGGHS